MRVWKKTQQTRGFKKRRGRTAKKRGHRPVPFGFGDSSWPGAVGSSGRLGAPLLEQKASALGRNKVFQAENSPCHRTGAFPTSGGPVLAAWLQCDSFPQGAGEQGSTLAAPKHSGLCSGGCQWGRAPRLWLG